jgi:hypothetical protein
MLAKKSKGKKAAKKEVVAAPAAAVAEEPVAVEPVAVEPVAADAPGGLDAIFPVEQPQLWEAHRVTTKAPTYDQVFQALSATPDESLRDFVNVNRDLLDYRFMYQMTGNVLRKQNTGDAAGSAELRARRDEVLRWLQRFDAELFQAIVAAEGRLGQLLAQYMTPGSSPSAEDVVQAAGSKPLEARAFPPHRPPPPSPISPDAAPPPPPDRLLPAFTPRPPSSRLPILRWPRCLDPARWLLPRAGLRLLAGRALGCGGVAPQAGH